MFILQRKPALPVLLVILFLLFAATFAEAQHSTRMRRPASSPKSAAASVDTKTQILQLTEELKASPRKLTEKHLLQCKQQLQTEINTLVRQLPRSFNRTETAGWKESLQLTELKATLQTKKPNTEILDAVQTVLGSDIENVKWTVFDGLRTALRRYLVIAGLLANEGSYERQMGNVCGNLVNVIDSYTTGKDPAGAALSDTVKWLDDIAIAEPRAGKLADLTRKALSGINVRLRVGSDFVTAGFRRELEEEVKVNENIDGTCIVGGGTMTGNSFAELGKNSKKGVINVIVEADVDTVTRGSHPPVSLQTHTTGTMRGEKPIIISAESISSPSANTKAKLNARIFNLCINAGPIIRAIAKEQVEEQKADSQREAARRAERRMNTRINEQIDPKIAELNEKYQKLRNLLVKTGLFPSVWNLSSTAQQIDWSILFADKYQPSAPEAAPAAKPVSGLSVQIHQSALNNAAAILLAGRQIDEEKSQNRLSEFFDKPPKFLERKTEDAPAKVSFGGGYPVDVSFLDNKIRVTVEIDGIQVMNNAEKSYTISVEYLIKTKKQDGKDVIVLERTEAEAFPSQFKKGAKLSATQTIIRSYLLRRLEALPKQQVMEPLKLEGSQWEGKGQLVPVSASAEKGWLTIGWNWK